MNKNIRLHIILNDQETNWRWSSWQRMKLKFMKEETSASLALGFGEVTISRYLEGQIPSKEYSDVVRAALASPAFMKQKLEGSL